MKLLFTLLSSLFLFTLGAFAQTNLSAFEKECRLAGGGGFANGFDGATGGPDIWLQMSYRLSKSFSVATEFENMYYKRPSVINLFGFLDKAHDKQTISDNYVSFLIKYHLPVKSKIAVAVVSGWSYLIKSGRYFDYETYSNGVSYIPRSYASENYSIPFILEVNYPLGKTLSAGIRGKYNLNTSDDGATYATALSVSLKL